MAPGSKDSLSNIQGCARMCRVSLFCVTVLYYTIMKYGCATLSSKSSLKQNSRGTENHFVTMVFRVFSNNNVFVM